MKKRLQSAFSSRQYMISKDIELYFYDDANLSGVENHNHDYYEFYFFLQGNISMVIHKQEYLLKSGDIVLIPPGVYHHTLNHDTSIPYRRFVFWISKDYYQHLTELSSDYEYIVKYTSENSHYVYHNDVISFNSIQAELFRLLEELHAERFGRDTKLHLGVNNLLLDLNRIAYEQKHPTKYKRNLTLYEHLLSYIETHLEEDLSLDHLAAVFYVNKYHISHIFKENMGLSVHQYVSKKRLSMCRDALLGNTNVGDLILMYGFNDYSSFYRAFKKEYGQSPKEYRETHGVKKLVAQ